MNKFDEIIGGVMFDRLRLEAQKLGFTDLLILKSALAGKVAFNELPDKLREAFARLGTAGALPRG
jgi:hypothetical protein